MNDGAMYLVDDSFFPPLVVLGARHRGEWGPRIEAVDEGWRMASWRHDEWEAGI